MPDQPFYLVPVPGQACPDGYAEVRDHDGHPVWVDARYAAMVQRRYDALRARQAGDEEQKSDTR